MERMMVAEAQDYDNQVVWLSRADEIAYFEEQARALLGMSGEEFRRRLDAGEFADVIDDPDCSDVLYLALLARVAR
jgi:hypothetical protein